MAQSRLGDAFIGPSGRLFQTRSIFMAAALAASSQVAGFGCSRASLEGNDSHHSQGTSNANIVEAAENESRDSTAGGAVKKSEKAREAKVPIPQGVLTVGSMPGDKGRDPALEPALLSLSMAGFSIDRFPFPNDPSKPALTGVNRAEAETRCKGAGGRLCTEVEWERACKGPDQSPYATGGTWDAECSKKGAECASGFGVVGMGNLREWTASDVAPIEDYQAKAAAVRGASTGASAVDRRCAKRLPLASDVTADDLGFRCCYGSAPVTQIESPKWEANCRRADVSPKDLAELFESTPQLNALQGELSFFREEDAKTVLSRGDAGGPPPNTTLTSAPLFWNPVPGEEVLLVAGKTKQDSFIVALYRLPKNRYRVAATFVMKGERGPIVLGYNNTVRRRVSWGMCWDCPGESGSITYRDDRRIVITQK